MVTIAGPKIFQNVPSQTDSNGLINYPGISAHLHASPFVSGGNGAFCVAKIGPKLEPRSSQIFDPRVGISDDMGKEVVKVSPQHWRILFLRGIHPQGDLKNAMSFDELVQTHVAIAILVVDLENFTRISRVPRCHVKFCKIEINCQLHSIALSTYQPRAPSTRNFSPGRAVEWQISGRKMPNPQHL